MASASIITGFRKKMNLQTLSLLPPLSPTPPTPPSAGPTSIPAQKAALWARCIAALPLSVCQRIGACLGWGAYFLSRSYRTKFLTQWHAGAVWSQAHLGRVWTEAQKRAAISHAGKMAVEALWVWCRPHQEVMAAVVCTDFAILEKAEALGKGEMYLTPHLGTFEVAARFCAQRRPMTALFKPSKQAVVNRLFEVARHLPGLTMAPADGSGVRKLLKALKTGQTIGLLPDQVPPLNQGVWTTFFGKPAYSMPLPEKLHAATGASVVMTFCERLAIGKGWHMHYKAFDGVPSPQAVNNAMQEWIAEHPEQYLWGYNRYKQPTAASSKGSE
jgi:Kdo2-lipid IVA lauroyltransferase/acyltransferase